MRNIITIIFAALIACWVRLFTDPRFTATAGLIDWIGAGLLFAVFFIGGVYFSRRLKKDL